MHPNPDFPDWLFRPLTPLELYILIALAECHNYAYCLAQTIPESLDASIRVTPLGVSRALHRMAKTGWIAPYPYMRQSGRRERAYAITDFGEAQLTAEHNRLTLILDQAHINLAIRENARAAQQNARLTPSPTP